MLMNSSLHKFLPSALAICLMGMSAKAELAAWYPLDEAPAAAAVVAENIASNNASMLGFDPNPLASFISRGDPSARPNLGTSYFLTKGGGLDLGTAGAVQPTDKFTISFWTQPQTLDAFDRFLESQVGNGNDQNGLRIDTGGAGNKVRVLLRDGNGATNSQFTHPVTLKNDGTWYFVAFRYDSAGIDNAPFQVTVLEADGTAVDDAAIAAATAGPATITTGPINAPHARGTLIGVEVPDNPAQPNNLNGALDELAFFENTDANGVLSDQQLADVYNFGPSGAQLINSFTSNLDSVVPGNPATLSWEVNAPFDALTLDDGLGNITDLEPETTAGAGSFEVSPKETTTYWLRATRGDAANVSALRILAGAAPDISQFTTSAPIIQSGGSAELSWVVAGATTLTLSPGDLPLTGETMTEVEPTQTTTYTLSATNPFGTSTAEVTVVVISGPLPTHRYAASFDENTDTAWLDEIDTRDWQLTGALRNSPLVTPSANTNLTAAYSTAGGLNGGATASFQLPEFTAEIWFRPGILSADHQVIFESGGGQNGLAVLITEDALRFIGSAANVRNLDFTIPIDGLNLEDFIQLVISNDAGTDAIEVSIRDTFGTVRTASEVADVIIGNNGAGLLVWAAGALGGDNNLGGRTELPDVTPAGLSGFAGEIAVVNIYGRILETADIEAAFDAVATTVAPPSLLPFAITKIEGPSANSVTLTWNSTVDHLYDAQFSTALQAWFDLEDTVSATESQTTKTFNIPPNQTEFYLRIIDLGLD
jgi:hypothetical protein